MKGRREWFIRVPWGKLALVGHGHPDGYPVFLVHGRQDSSSVFEPLIEQMTGAYNYVALDMPGNGLSDAFPPGPKLMRFHFLAAMELAIEHLGWDRFIFIGHSMGCEQGLFYSVIHPGQISRMILLDAGPTLMRMQVEDHVEYQRYYDSYYEHYVWENFERKPYVREMALQALERHRELTRNQSEIIIARNFHGFNFYNKQKCNKKLNKDEVQNAKANGTRNTNEDNAQETPKTNGNEITNDQTAEETPKSNGNENTNGQTAEEAPKNYGNENTNDQTAEQAPKSNGNENTNGQTAEEAPKSNGNENTNDQTAEQAPKSNGIENTNGQTAEEAPKSNGNENTNDQTAEQAPKSNGNENTNDQTAEGAPKSNGNENTNETQNAEPEHSANVAPNPPAPGDLNGLVERRREEGEVGYLSWDNRLKNLAPQNYGNAYYFALFKTIPPTLLIAASDGAKKVPPNSKWRQGVKELFDRMATLDNFNRVDVQGGHDVHFTHPERVLPYINAFLKDSKVFSKL